MPPRVRHRPFADRRGGLAGDVGHPEATPDAKLVQFELVKERREHRQSLSEALEGEDLGPDVRVEPDQAHPAGGVPKADDGSAAAPTPAQNRTLNRLARS